MITGNWAMNCGGNTPITSKVVIGRQIREAITQFSSIEHFLVPKITHYSRQQDLAVKQARRRLLEAAVHAADIGQ